MNTHTHHEHTPGAVGSHLCFGARGAVGGFSTLLKGTSVVVLKVGGGSTVHSLPHLQFLPARDSNSQPFDYKSDPPLGHDFPMYAEIFQELTQHKVQHPQINCKNKKRRYALASLVHKVYRMKSLLSVCFTSQYGRNCFSNPASSLTN